jgi:hypothetical protein
MSRQHYTRSVLRITRAAGSQRLGGAVRSAVAPMDPALPIVATPRLDEPALQLRVAASVSSCLGNVGLPLAAIDLSSPGPFEPGSRQLKAGLKRPALPVVVQPVAGRSRRCGDS